MNEFMAPVASHGPIYSPLTLAIMEDSGWYKALPWNACRSKPVARSAEPHVCLRRYKAHYNMSQPLVWGRNQGCSFVEQKCVVGGNTLEGYCTDGSQRGCTPDYMARGYCDLTTWSADLPAAFQYFSNPRVGGEFSLPLRTMGPSPPSALGPPTLSILRMVMTRGMVTRGR